MMQGNIASQSLRRMLATLADNETAAQFWNNIFPVM
jgi:hypothetical protein